MTSPLHKLSRQFYVVESSALGDGYYENALESTN